MRYELIPAAFQPCRADHAASANIIPSSIGAIKEAARHYPVMKGLFPGMAFSMPTLDVEAFIEAKAAGWDISMIDMSYAISDALDGTRYETITDPIKVRLEFNNGRLAMQRQSSDALDKTCVVSITDSGNYVAQHIPYIKIIPDETNSSIPEKDYVIELTKHELVIVIGTITKSDARVSIEVRATDCNISMIGMSYVVSDAIHNIRYSSITDLINVQIEVNDGLLAMLKHFSAALDRICDESVTDSREYEAQHLCYVKIIPDETHSSIPIEDYEIGITKHELVTVLAPSPNREPGRSL